MSVKYTFSESTYFPVPLNALEKRPGVERLFPLFIYLKRNDRLVLRFESGEAIREDQIGLYRKNGLVCFWCPNEFRDDFDAYVRGEASQPKTAPAPAAEAEVAPAEDQIFREAPFEGEATPLSDDELDALLDTIENEQAAEAVEVMSARDFTPAEKKEMLSKIAKQVTTTLQGITADEPEELEAALVNCQEFADEIIRVAAATHKAREICEAVSMLKDMVPQHSGVTSSLAVIFAMGLGYDDTQELTDLSFAGTLHDLGLIRLPPELLNKDWDTLEGPEQIEFGTHVEESIALIGEKAIPVSDRILLLIRQHHERFDGKGYPKGLKGEEIDPYAQILSVADSMDEYLSGKRGGKRLSPLEAAKKLESSGAFAPELIGTVISMLEEPLPSSTEDSVA